MILGGKTWQSENILLVETKKKISTKDPEDTEARIKGGKKGPKEKVQSR